MTAVAGRRSRRGGPLGGRPGWGRDGAELAMNPEAEWTAGASTVRLSLRFSPDGRPTAILRERDRSNPIASPTRIRQVTLAREGAEDRLVGQAPARPRRESAFAGSIKGEQAALYAARVDGSGLRMGRGAPTAFRGPAIPPGRPDGLKIAFTGFDATGRDPLVFVVVDARGGPTVAVASGGGAEVVERRVEDRLHGQLQGRIRHRLGPRPAATTSGSRPSASPGRGAGDVEVLARGLWPRWSPTGRPARVRGAVGVELGTCYLRSVDGASARPPDRRPGDRYESELGARRPIARLPVRSRQPLGPLPGLRRRPRRPPQADRPQATRGIGRHQPRRQFRRLQRRSRSSQTARILILDLASGSDRPLLDPSQGERDPSWSPDGRSLAFVSRRPSPLLPIGGRASRESRSGTIEIPANLANFFVDRAEMTLLSCESRRNPTPDWTVSMLETVIPSPEPSTLPPQGKGGGVKLVYIISPYCFVSLIAFAAILYLRFGSIRAAGRLHLG